MHNLANINPMFERNSRLNPRKPIVGLLFAAITAVGSQAQTFTTLANFDTANGSGSSASLVQGFDGNFYGATLFGGINGLGLLQNTLMVQSLYQQLVIGVDPFGLAVTEVIIFQCNLRHLLGKCDLATRLYAFGNEPINEEFMYTSKIKL